MSYRQHSYAGEEERGAEYGSDSRSRWVAHPGHRDGHRVSHRQQRHPGGTLGRPPVLRPVGVRDHQFDLRRGGPGRPTRSRFVLPQAPASPVPGPSRRLCRDAGSGNRVVTRRSDARPVRQLCARRGSWARTPDPHLVHRGDRSLLSAVALAVRSIPTRHRARVIGGLAVAAIVWRAAAIGVMSPGWVYNATDTNAAALFVGAYLAVASPTKSRTLVRWSIPVLLGLMLLPVFGDAGRGVLWGGFVALTLSAMAVRYASTGPTWLEHRVLLRVAEVSFGLYLWHYVFVRSDIPLWTAVIATAVATGASWFLVERPVLHWDAKLRNREIASFRRVRLAHR